MTPSLVQPDSVQGCHCRAEGVFLHQRDKMGAQAPSTLLLRVVPASSVLGLPPLLTSLTYFLSSALLGLLLPSFLYLQDSSQLPTQVLAVREDRAESLRWLVQPAPPRRRAGAKPHTGWPGGSAGGGCVHFDRRTPAPCCRMGWGGQGWCVPHRTCWSCSLHRPPFLCPEPPFQHCGQALGIHVGGMGAGLGETLGGWRRSTPWNRVTTEGCRRRPVTILSLQG